MKEIDFDLLKPMGFVLKGLAGAKERGTRGYVEELLSPFADARDLSSVRDEVVIAGTTYPIKLRNELSAESDFGNSPRVTPAGARFLVALYEKDVLPMDGKTTEKRVDPAITAYIESEAELVALTEERAAQERLRNEAYRAKVENPAAVTESEFEYSLLNDIFFKHKGAGEGSMTIDGIEVSKSLTNRKSNSGKSSDWKVRFTWKDAQGDPKCIEKPSMYDGNRRNDADRNWGLGQD